MKNDMIFCSIRADIELITTAATVLPLTWQERGNRAKNILMRGYVDERRQAILGP